MTIRVFLRMHIGFSSMPTHYGVHPLQTSISFSNHQISQHMIQTLRMSLVVVLILHQTKNRRIMNLNLYCGNGILSNETVKCDASYAIDG